VLPTLRGEGGAAFDAEAACLDSLAQRSLVRLKFAILGTLALTACTGSGTVLNAPQVPPQLVMTITTNLPSGAGLLQGVVGPDGRIWFGEFYISGLAAVPTAGVVTSYPASPFSQPLGITVGPHGNIWTGGFGHTMDQVSPTGSLLNTYSLSGAHIGALIPGPGGVFWFTDYGNNKIGTMTTSGSITEYSMGGYEPIGMAVGRDGNLGVTDDGNAGMFGATGAIDKGLAEG
jgi:streptogramin lyase